MAKFSEEEQPKKRRGKSGRTLVLEGIKAAIPECKDKDEAQTHYFKHVAKRAFDPDDKDSSTLLKLLGDKAWASVKPSAALIEFDFPVNGTPTEKSLSIIDAIATGSIAPDIGQMMIGVIKDAVIIEEGTDLKIRIEELEKALGLASV